MGRSWNLDDELDALIEASRNGSRAARCGELAPLVEVAVALRAALSVAEIDPGVARQHVSRAVGASRFAPAGRPLNGFGRRIGTEIAAEPVPLGAARPGRSRLRRRITMVALAAALTLIPATMVSGGSLPGQPLYPVKRSVEQVRLAALAWSPGGTAGEQLRIADVRAAELASLVKRGSIDRVPGAIIALQHAVDSAGQAVDQASLGEVDSGQEVALRQGLAEVTSDQIVQLTAVSQTIPTTSPAATQAIEAANEALVSAKRKLEQGQYGGAADQVAPPPTSAP